MPTADGVRARARRGFTFLEVVAASVILAGIGVILFTVGGNLSTGNWRQVHQLNAAELANRLMLQYIDDPEKMPSPSAPVSYNDSTYRWSMEETPVTVTIARPETDASAAAGFTSRDRLERYKIVRMRVWLSEENRGGLTPEPWVPQASLSRLHNPDSIQSWNPDKRAREMAKPGGMQRILERLRGGRPSSNAATNSGAGGNR